MKKNNEKVISIEENDEQYKKRFKYKYPNASSIIGLALMGIFLIYWFATQYKYALISSEIYSKAGFILLGMSVLVGSLTICIIITYLIGYFFFGKSEDELKRDKEIKTIKDKYRKLREIKRHEKRMKELNHIPLEN